MKQNPFKNVGEIHKEWTAAGVSASRTTTHRRMQDMGFSCRIPCVKPLLNNRQRQKRLDWTAAEWSKVMFSDESKFCISFGNQGPRVWRKRGEAQNPRCLRSSVKFPQSVMVWGVVMRGSGFFPTRGSRFYEIIWPAPHHCIYFYNPPRPAPATIK